MPPRRTKIIATIGPASRSEAAVRSLIDAGVDTFRLNFSYGSHDEHAEAFDLIRRLSRDAGRPVAIMQDLQGPKVRVGKLANGPYRLEPGEETTFTTDDVRGDAACVPVKYAALPQVVKTGDRILLGDGEAELRVESVAGPEVRARVIEGGVLKENQGMHLPGVALSDEALSEKDLADLQLGVRLGVDYVALSFVRSGDDVRRLKELIKEQGARIPVIAKLEKKEAIEALGEILAAADGVMVARGDLGLELGPEKVPLLQKRIIRQANRQRILVITATQMLESMTSSPRPTRAEASDVANAILDGTDAVMLSAETAVGRYPAQAVRMMARIAEAAEREPRGDHAEGQSAPVWCESSAERRCGGGLSRRRRRTGRSRRAACATVRPVLLDALGAPGRAWARSVRPSGPRGRGLDPGGELTARRRALPDWSRSPHRMPKTRLTATTGPPHDRTHRPVPVAVPRRPRRRRRTAAQPG